MAKNTVLGWKSIFVFVYFFLNQRYNSIKRIFIIDIIQKRYWYQVQYYQYPGQGTWYGTGYWNTYTKKGTKLLDKSPITSYMSPEIEIEMSHVQVDLGASSKIEEATQNNSSTSTTESTHCGLCCNALVDTDDIILQQEREKAAEYTTENPLLWWVKLLL